MKSNEINLVMIAGLCFACFQVYVTPYIMKNIFRSFVPEFRNLVSGLWIMLVFISGALLTNEIHYIRDTKLMAAMKAENDVFFKQVYETVILKLQPETK